MMDFSAITYVEFYPIAFLGCKNLSNNFSNNFNQQKWFSDKIILSVIV